MELEEIADDALVVPLDLVPQVFSPRRVEIIQTLRREGPFPTQAALAAALGRAPSHVSVDLRYLEGIGLVDRLDGVRSTDRPIMVD